MVGRRRLWWLVVGPALLAAACSGAKPQPVPTPGANIGASAAVPGGLITPQDLAAQPGGLETVRVAYQLLMDKYYKPIKSNDLLRAAWDGVVQELVKEGGSDNGVSPTLTGDRDADFKAFGDSFNAVAAGGDKSKFAFAAVTSMARSLHDDHTAFLPAETYKQFGVSGPATSPPQVFTTKMLPGNVAYMKLSEFPPGYEKLQDGKTLAEELDEALASFESQGAKGWILDLRNNGGGHTESIATMVGRFVPAGLQEIDVDGKGERFQVPVDGHYFAHQRPLAVLINGRSASASEITAQALKDYGAARLFGTKSAGAVNGAEIQPLPGQVGLEYTVVQALAGKTNKPLDKAGVDPDEVVEQQAGQDSQLSAAQTWVTSASAPSPSGTPATAKGALSEPQLRSQLGAYAPAISDIPPLPDLRVLGDVGLTTPGEYAVWAPCTTDAEELQRSASARGWQGQFDEFYGNGDPFTYQVGVDIYKDSSGAQQAFRANECPQGLQAAQLPVHIGDESVAFKGTGILDGWTALRWRRDRLVFTAYYYAEPGLESFDPLVQMAKAADAKYTAKPLK